MADETQAFALTVHQPWAELLVTGRKSIELRTWPTEYRGRLWVHASRKLVRPAAEQFGLKNVFQGGFVGSINLVAVVPLTRDRWESWRPRHLDPGQFNPGLLAWLVDEPRRLRRPLPYRGMPGLFRPAADVAALLERVPADPPAP